MQQPTTHTDQQLYAAALAYDLEASAWNVRDRWIEADQTNRICVMRKTEIIQEFEFCAREAAQELVTRLRRVAAMKAALAVLGDKQGAV